MVPLSRANTWKRREEGGGDNSFRGADKLDFLGASVVAERRAVSSSLSVYDGAIYGETPAKDDFHARFAPCGKRSLRLVT